MEFILVTNLKLVRVTTVYKGGLGEPESSREGRGPKETHLTAGDTAQWGPIKEVKVEDWDGSVRSRQYLGNKTTRTKRVQRVIWCTGYNGVRRIVGVGSYVLN